VSKSSAAAATPAPAVTPAKAISAVSESFSRNTPTFYATGPHQAIAVFSSRTEYWKWFQANKEGIILNELAAKPLYTNDSRFKVLLDGTCLVEDQTVYTIFSKAGLELKPAISKSEVTSSSIATQPPAVTPAKAVSAVSKSSPRQVPTFYKESEYTAIVVASPNEEYSKWFKANQFGTLKKLVSDRIDEGDSAYSPSQFRASLRVRLEYQNKGETIESIFKEVGFELKPAIDNSKQEQ
jgi:hypothetical protein